MKYDVEIGDIWEGTSSTWNESTRFKVDRLTEKSAFMKETLTGDVTKVSLSFVTLKNWRLLKRIGQKTLCKECDHIYE